MEIRRTALAGLLLALLVLALYHPAAQFEFLDFDDNLYVTENLEVRQGLSAGWLGRAFSANLAGHWQPATFLSHALDVHLFGLHAGSHHMVSVALHTANALLLLLLARWLGLAVLPSFFLALLFAVHPLRVESVAWIAERKDVLSMFWLLVTLLAYVAFTRTQSAWLYGLTVVCFALGLLSKAMLVTIPCALLVMDWWPLKRVSSVDLRRWGQLALEKWPLFLLAGIFSVAAAFSQKHAGAMHTLDALPVGVRIQTAVIAYATYLGAALWPAHLAPLHAHPFHWPAWRVAVCAAILIAASFAAWRLRRDRPWWLAGWLWYLGTLLPVSGILQVGNQWMADRYTYIPMLGPLAAVVVQGGLRARRSRAAAVSLCLAGTAAGLLLAWRTSTYLPVWADSSSLTAAGMAGSGGHLSMRTNAAILLAREGRMSDAIAAFEAIRRDYPHDAEAANNLGFALLSSRAADRAIPQFRQAVSLDPAYHKARVNLGQALAVTGQSAQALAEFERVMRDDPLDPAAYAHAAMLTLPADPARALELALKASELTPGQNLLALDAEGKAQAALGQTEAAAAAWRRAAAAARQLGRPDAAAKFELQSRQTGP